MSQPISIYTTGGVRLDVLPEATIEVNMGGISLLDLNNRTATYTNSFDLPRTPTNESVFSYVSQPTRNNRPVIDVIITKGLFQKKARLKVTSYESKYKCSLSFDTDATIDKLKQNTIDSLSLTKTFGVTTEEGIISLLSEGIDEWIYLRTCSIPRIPSALYRTRSLFIKLPELLNIISTELSISFTGTLLSDTYFSNGYLCIPSAYVSKSGVGPTYTFKLAGVTMPIKLSDILKEITLLFFSDMSVNGTVVTLNKIVFENDVYMDGFEYTKQLYSGLNKYNRIVYNVSELVENKLTASDMFESTGTDDKNIIELKTYLPSGDGNIFYMDTDPNVAQSIIIAAGIYETGKVVKFNSTSATLDFGYRMSMYDLNLFYSTILEPILKDPVILNASAWIDPFKANSIMTNRVINSVQLGGRYWVDSMAYNLVTGQSKLTLIKI